MGARLALLVAVWGHLLASARGACTSRFIAPQRGELATDYNGVALPPACFNASSKEREHHVFVIGDWGGLIDAPGHLPAPADHRSTKFPTQTRRFVNGTDDQAQLLVAEQMRRLAVDAGPEYIINVGDNFYWGGIEAFCGSPLHKHKDPLNQWGAIFEDVYVGEGLDGKQWLGVLGNHDYGGFSFTGGWDQAIGYTWGGPTSTGRWMTPAQYWQTKVYYNNAAEDFPMPNWSVDYYFVDSNVFDAHEKHLFPGHNICSAKHNIPGASCGAQGPHSVDDCPGWFERLWVEQMEWLMKALPSSTADWQIVVTHFPPEFGKEEWLYLCRKFGIDLLVTGHRHMQEVHGNDDPNNFLAPTAYIVSGGGGGITSESVPTQRGEDDAYGFVDMTIWRRTIEIKAISHGGQIRSRTWIDQVPPGVMAPEEDELFERKWTTRTSTTATTVTSIVEDDESNVVEFSASDFRTEAAASSTKPRSSTTSPTLPTPLYPDTTPDHSLASLDVATSTTSTTRTSSTTTSSKGASGHPTTSTARASSSLTSLPVTTPRPRTSTQSHTASHVPAWSSEDMLQVLDRVAVKERKRRHILHKNFSGYKISPFRFV